MAIMAVLGSVLHQKAATGRILSRNAEESIVDNQAFQGPRRPPLNQEIFGDPGMEIFAHFETEKLAGPGRDGNLIADIR